MSVFVKMMNVLPVAHFPIFSMGYCSGSREMKQRFTHIKIPQYVQLLEHLILHYLQHGLKQFYGLFYDYFEVKLLKSNK